MCRQKWRNIPNTPPGEGQLAFASWGEPGRVDTAWRPKHYPDTPASGVAPVTLNLARVAIAAEFTAAEIAEASNTTEPTVADVARIDPSAVADMAANGTVRVN